MKRSFQSILAFALVLLVAAGVPLQAQTESVRESKSVSISTGEDGKVTLKVTIKKGYDTTTFEKTYDSYDDMYDDPELEEYGIAADDLGFGARGFSFGSPKANLFFHQGPGMRFWDDDDDDAFSRSFSFGFDLDSLMEQMDQFRSGGGPFSFRFGPNGSFDIDSLMSQFDFDGGTFMFNGDEFMDIDSLRERMREQFDNFDFDFDFDDEDNGRGGFRSFYFNGDDDDEDNPRVISRVRVYVRSARDADKAKVGADAMDDLKIKDISFYPNPSDGRFSLELETGNQLPVYIKIVGPNGATVYERTEEAVDGYYDFDINISDQGEGIYILQVIQGKSALTKRIIIE